VRAIQELLKKQVPESRLSLQALPSRLGLRESRHVKALYQLTGDEVLYGRRFEDAITQGSYRSDVHHQDKPGITLRYLDGTQTYNVPGQPATHSRWRPETPENPTFYQIPYRSLLPEGGYGKLIVAGRMLDMDPLAHAAVRVMVNLNQTGEAAGVAAVLAMRNNCSFADVSVTHIQAELAAGGSAEIQRAG
jgi:hypothetical protein